MNSGMPSIVTVNKSNKYKIIIENSAPYDVTLGRNEKNWH